MKYVMYWCFQWTLDCVNVYVPILMAIGSIATAGALIFIIRTFQTERKHLFIRNFSELVDQIGSNETKEYLSWIKYDDDKKKLFDEFINMYDKDYHKISADERKKYGEIPKACWHLCGVYNRVAVLLTVDDKIKDKFIQFHGDTILEIWKILKVLINKHLKIINEGESPQLKPYRYFKDLGEELEKKYCKTYQTPKVSAINFFISKLTKSR